MPGEFRTRELKDDLLIVTHTIDDSHDGWRADSFLKLQYKHFSRNQLHGLIDEGRILIVRSSIGHADDVESPLKASTTVRMGDKVRVLTKRAFMDEPAVDFKYKILFEDDTILAIDKPANLPVHPAGKFLFNTLLMQLRRERADWLAKGHDFFLIHRLDRETSGVILLAKTSAAAGLLVKQFRERQTEKRYFAIAAGHCPEMKFTVDADMGSDRNSLIRLKMAAFPKGQGELDALTHFEVVKRGENADLIDCKLETGRQHQIRVHLAYVGHPVVGDKLYGTQDFDEQIFLDHINRRPLSEETWGKLKIDRHALHSRYLRFYHDTQGKWIELESPLPPDMERLLK